jgi:hypothetical protein
MRTSQELASALTERMKNAMKNGPAQEPVDRRGEIIPGKRYRDERGRMVTVLRASSSECHTAGRGTPASAKQGAESLKLSSLR